MSADKVEAYDSVLAKIRKKALQHVLTSRLLAQRGRAEAARARWLIARCRRNQWRMAWGDAVTPRRRAARRRKVKQRSHLRLVAPRACTTSERGASG